MCIYIYIYILWRSPRWESIPRRSQETGLLSDLPARACRTEHMKQNTTARHQKTNADLVRSGLDISHLKREATAFKLANNLDSRQQRASSYAAVCCAFGTCDNGQVTHNCAYYICDTIVCRIIVCIIVGTYNIPYNMLYNI